MLLNILVYFHCFEQSDFRLIPVTINMFDKYIFTNEHCLYYSDEHFVSCWLWSLESSTILVIVCKNCTRSEEEKYHTKYSAISYKTVNRSIMKFGKILRVIDENSIQIQLLSVLQKDSHSVCLFHHVMEYWNTNTRNKTLNVQLN